MTAVIHLSELSTAKRAGNVITVSLLSAYDLPATSWGQMTCRPYCFKQTVDSDNCAAWKVDHNITPPPPPPLITHMLLDISSYTPTRSFHIIFTQFALILWYVLGLFGPATYIHRHCFPFCRYWIGLRQTPLSEKVQPYIWRADGVPSLHLCPSTTLPVFTFTSPSLNRWT